MKRIQVISRHFTAGATCTASNCDRPSFIASAEEYKKLHDWSINDPNGFWSYMAKDYVWAKQWDKDHLKYNFDISKGPISIEWFRGGQTNITYNCLDRWVAQGRGKQPCFVWEGNDLGQQRTMTYSEVLDEVCRVSNWLKSEGVKKGDAVTIYMPMLCELPITMLACARIGAVHSVVFAGFSADSVAQRIIDCKGNVVVTASGVMRGTKLVPLKALVDQAISICAKHGHQVTRVLCFEDSALSRDKTPWAPLRDVWYHDVIPRQSPRCPAVWLDAEDRLFLLYTSGSTGKPKGVVHTTGGYMVGTGVTTKYVFDMHPGDVFWCSADCGWITGHSYLTYGPLLNGATSILFGATPSHPTPARVWQVIEKHKVRQFYTAPTLLRSLLQLGDEWVTRHDRSTLRVLGSVGEPINEHAWHWFHEVVGEKRCPIVDTWWQTETGMHMVTPFPGSWCKLKPGAASLPFFGVQPVLLSPEGQEMSGPGEGILAIKGPWPAMARTLHGDHERFASVYFAPFKGYYFTGDGCRRDEDSYIWITGRVDDVINVSGHRIGTAEVESALTEHDECAEAAVIGVDHAVKGQAIYAYVTLKNSGRNDDSMRTTLMEHVRKTIGPFAVPEVIHWAPALPKTRSGKIMRRVLRKIATGQEKEIGDVSTLAEPGVLESLIAQRGR
mmetsp:Transcript_7614/g.16508  ORF Transcript_7614/g.16508 Transcript_7614/m.16508 type:complete len:668 (-) Transcript_7614:1182-3185(-)|eukprot:CAMPEP_0202901200 /NCGR_PEP_ID=MMETSP1392-20130828/13915_1 /ASSEMBLY_ACC=CAM_ASM_000868 /TAXON_ID=225041 /ORGANISM="Chlamydomonas chlamydogama, Strain SAG 11-48b" /LENGTH=667 /DNA_ID=CAMNT_0049587723 /DNA_START=340 /DNA_END=2343 /DNA_ORIENTATION=+